MLASMQKSVLLALLAVAAVGCGGGNQMDGGGDDSPPPIDSSVTPDSPPPPPGFTRLIGRNWSLQAGLQDIYRCVRITIPQDMYITNIIAQAPLGTHHTVLSIMPGTDGEADCGVGTLGLQMLYASGVGTSPLEFPSGVGIKVAAGTQIHLNLHLYNASDQTLTGDSAILVKAQSTPPPMLAEMVFAGKIRFSIPATPQQDYIVQGGCTVNTPYKLFAVWPHMHQLAKHQRVELIRGTTTTVLHDLPYQFSEQKYYPQAPELQVQANDRIVVKCTYFNNTGKDISSGDSSDQEMCFSGLYRYPATNSGLFSCSSL
jgi:Copper type II ascorbate-dependent monooxygenase, C-terminal domain